MEQKQLLVNDSQNILNIYSSQPAKQRNKVANANSVDHANSGRPQNVLHIYSCMTVVFFTYFNIRLCNIQFIFNKDKIFKMIKYQTGNYNLQQTNLKGFCCRLSLTSLKLKISISNFFQPGKLHLRIRTFEEKREGQERRYMNTQRCLLSAYHRIVRSLLFAGYMQ